MQVTHKISFPGKQQFEQHTAVFSLSSEDVSAEEFKKISIGERMFVLNFLVLYEGLLFQFCEGYISVEAFKEKQKLLFKILPEHLKSLVNTLLSGKKDGD